MSAAASLMVLPSSPDPDAPAQFYLLGAGIWHEVPLQVTARIGLKAVREGVDGLLRDIMTKINQGAADNARVTLEAKCRRYWSDLLPVPVGEYLTSALAGAIEPPCVLVYTSPKLEWVPWELLHDGTNFLGLRCRVARLPIVPNGPVNADSRHAVRNAASFLGAGVFDAHTPQVSRWANTLALAEGSGVVVQRFPANGGANWPGLENIQAAASVDIIHLTCHGGVDDQGRPYLTLDPEDDYAGIDEDLATTLNFPPSGPLVFANACGSPRAAAPSAAATRGIAVAFFDRGASAYVGAIAPISKAVALEFAHVFYERLLTDGLAVGEALRSTKEHFQKANTTDPSWLFYTLYGSPDTRFVPEGVP
ncbi:CHAT domain-containing protein [Kribbella qitaiheensis]|uniref:CHAT domain-containing protein n=1 Tax=Kribbella qitaiheensis TaxID=1544730 RepID=UPI00362038C1